MKQFLIIILAMAICINLPYSQVLLDELVSKQAQRFYLRATDAITWPRKQKNLDFVYFKPEHSYSGKLSHPSEKANTQVMNNFTMNL